MSASKTELQPRITTFDEAEEIKPFGTPARIMLRTEDTGGAFSALLVMHAPGDGPPPHRHAGQAEYFFVVEGTYEMTVGGETRTRRRHDERYGADKESNGLFHLSVSPPAPPPSPRRPSLRALASRS